MSSSDTENRLRDWRYGQVQAERLAAALLHIEGFRDVDPQHPLGGPDGLKDVLCKKDDLLWVAAAHFPPTRQSFPEIKTKFIHDLNGVSANGAQAFAFFVNQHLTAGERNDLTAQCSGLTGEIYHLERMCGLLNAPKGCGIRLEYLRIPMTEAEQWAFWSNMNADVIRVLVENEERHDIRLSRLDNKLDLILARTKALDDHLTASTSSLAQGWSPFESLEMPTASLTVSTLCWLHRIVTEGLGYPESVRGRLRAVQVWIGRSGSSLQTADYVPPSPRELVGLTSDFVVWWRQRHVELRGKTKSDVVAGLAVFHHRFLNIHPFLDGNGRVSRVLLDQAARELLNQSVGQEFTSNPAEYFRSLVEADKGNFEPLQHRIMACLE